MYLCVAYVLYDSKMEGTVILIWFVILIFLIILKRYLQSRSLPPGPIGLPVFGSILNIALTCYQHELQIYEVFSRLATRYGKVFSFWLGSKLVVVVNDVASAKEAFMSEDIADRPVVTLFDEMAGGTGVLFGSGQIWRDQRKFSLVVFRRLGIGKTSFEKLICTEVRHVVMEFKAQKNLPFCPADIFMKATSNVVSSVVLGKRFSYSDTEFNNVIRRMERNFQILGAGGVLLFFPGLKYIPSLSKILNEYSVNLKKNRDFVADIVEQHKANLDEDNPRDFVDACLLETAHREADGRNTLALAENNLIVTILNIFAGGSDTTATTICWFLLHMIAYPQIQEKIHEEIDSVLVARDGLPQLSDKPDLPYTVAVTLEVMRLKTIFPIAVPHSASSDTYIQGYRIPKDTIVISNLIHMLHEQDVWDDPLDFKPERFLDENGHLNSKSANIVSFGIGRRVCLGENIAKMEIFLFITHLMHQFTFEKPDNSPPLSFKGSGGSTYKPSPFQFVAVSRDTQ